MDKDTKASLQQFTQKALQRLEAKKVTKYRKLYIPSMDEHITVRSLSKAEITEVFAIEDNLDSDIYTTYLGVDEPNLREVASNLKRDNKIAEYTDVVDIFTMNERTDIVKHILELSEVLSSKKVKVVETVKNS